MADETTFKDHFSGNAAAYTQFRPSYPQGLFDWLASVSPGRELAWDCGCGNGQAALGLAPHFRRIIATDASRQQIDHAMPHERVEYRVAPAEASGIEPASVDLIVIAQALHWFDFERFYREVRRVARPQAVIAAITYGELRGGGALDEVIDHFYTEIVGPYWPRERRYVDEGYQTISFPFSELSPPAFEMAAEWTLDHLVGYLGTWSAVKEDTRVHGRNPLEVVGAKLVAAWGEPSRTKKITWPLHLRVGRVTG
ncbi:MAG TPA: class I SAM-dependent methyltransferase [Geobacteraceae bacterium]